MDARETTMSVQSLDVYGIGIIGKQFPVYFLTPLRISGFFIESCQVKQHLIFQQAQILSHDLIKDGGGFLIVFFCFVTITETDLNKQTKGSVMAKIFRRRSI